MAAKTRKKNSLAWMNSMVYGKREEYGVCEEFQLLHITGGSAVGNQVESYQVSSEIAEDAVKAIHDQIFQTAEADATALGKTQRYTIYAMFREETSGELVMKSRWTFAQAPDDDSGEQGFDTEPATAVGMLAQSQRHLEGIMRLNMMQQSSTLQTMNAMLEKLATVNDKLLTEKFETIELMATLLDKRDERQAKLDEMKQGTALKQKMADNVLPMIQGVIMKMAGPKMLESTNGQADPLRQGLISFFEGMTPEQLEKVMEPLNDGQKVVIMTIAQEIMAAKEAKQAQSTQHEPQKEET